MHQNKRFWANCPEPILSPQTDGVLGSGAKAREKLLYRARHPHAQFNQAWADKVASRRKKKNHRASRLRNHIKRFGPSHKAS